MRFTVRRQASAEVSPCCHRPSGGDVPCSVHVGVARPGVAGFALENRLALAVLGSDVPARRASLRRVGGRDLLDPTESLVLQARGEQTPAALADATVEAALLCGPLARLLDGSARRARHSAHVKGFDADRLEAPRDVRGGLLDPVFASIGFTRFQLRDRQLRASSPIGAAYGAREPLLQHLQPLRLTPGKAGCVQQFASRSRRFRNWFTQSERGTAIRTATMAFIPSVTSQNTTGSNQKKMNSQRPLNAGEIAMEPTAVGMKSK